MMLASVLQRIRDEAWYLNVALVTPVVASFAKYLVGDGPLIKAQSAAVIVAVLGSLLSLILWIPYSRRQVNRSVGYATLTGLLVVWSLQTTLILRDNSVFNITTFALPLIALQVLIKPPNAAQAIRAVAVTAYALIVIAGVTLILDAANVSADAFNAERTGFSRIPILSDLLNIQSRWEGPFGNVNYAAPIGGFLIVFGVTSSQVNRVVFTTSGLIFLILSQGRNAILATVAGLLVLLIMSPRISQLKHGRALRWLLASISLLGAYAYIRLIDPTMGGRTQLWHDYLDLWQGSKFWGVGDSGINTYVLSGGNFSEVAHNHGHSIFIDTLARHGLVLTIPVVILLILALWLGFSAVSGSGPQALAMTVFAICTGLAETTLSSSYLNLMTLPLIAAIVLGASATSRRISDAIPTH
jgi:O-antigen ligase